MHATVRRSPQLRETVCATNAVLHFNKQGPQTVNSRLYRQKSMTHPDTCSRLQIDNRMRSRENVAPQPRALSAGDRNREVKIRPH